MIVRGSNGLPITVRLPEDLPSISGGAAGTGGAVARARVPVVVGGVTANLEIAKAVPVAQLAKVARLAARASGPLALAGLVYDGVEWVSGEWRAPPEPDPTVEGAWAVQHTSYGLHLRRGTPEEACRAGFAYQGAKQYASTSYLSGGSGPMTPDAQWGCYSTQGYLEFAVKFLVGYTCPNGGTLLSDGRCQPAGDGGPATDQQLEISFQQGLIAAPSSAGSVLDAAIAAESAAVGEFGAEPVTISGPATVDGGTRTSSSVGPNGTVTTTVQTTYNFDYSGDTVNITETQVTTVTDVNGSTVTTTTTEVPASAAPVSPSEPAEDVECGLPGMPPCKIDETGTPTGEDVRSEGEAAIQEGYDAIEGGISGLGDAPVDDLGWSWSFDFPAASCSALVINFRSYSRVVDWCPILGQMRAIWGWAVGVMGALFVWRRATSPM